MKTIGIIGAGNIGKTVATHLLKNNIPVILSNSKGPDTLAGTIEQMGNSYLPRPSLSAVLKPYFV